MAQEYTGIHVECTPSDWYTCFILGVLTGRNPENRSLLVVLPEGGRAIRGRASVLKEVA